MGTFASNHIQTDKLRHLRSDSRFCIFVIWKSINNSLARCRLFSVVNQLWTGVIISDGFQARDFFGLIVIKIFEPSWVSKKVCLVFMQLNVWDESPITNIVCEMFFQKFDPFFRKVTQL